MTNENGALPVLVIDGACFSDFDGFAREFSRLLCHWTWNGSLDALNDILRGGFGTPGNGWVLKWVNSELSRAALGYEATIRRLEQTRQACHSSHHADITARINNARRGAGPTLFDDIVEIIRDHGPGGDEPEDGLVLKLV
jgi:hypothetical protein